MGKSYQKWPWLKLPNSFLSKCQGQLLDKLKYLKDSSTETEKYQSAASLMYLKHEKVNLGEKLKCQGCKRDEKHQISFESNELL